MVKLPEPVVAELLMAATGRTMVPGPVNSARSAGRDGLTDWVFITEMLPWVMPKVHPESMLPSALVRLSVKS